MQLVDSWIKDKWRYKWNNQPSGNYQRTFIFHDGFSYKFKSRKIEIIALRFRMLQTRLNQGLLKINLHPTGLCDQCGIMQDSSHYIFDCVNTEELRKELYQLNKVKSDSITCGELLSNPNALLTLAKYFAKNEASRTDSAKA